MSYPDAPIFNFITLMPLAHTNIMITVVLLTLGFFFASRAVLE